MNELIEIKERRIGGTFVQSVNARDLHSFLEVGRDFSNWIKDRIQQFDFDPGVDFEAFEDSSSPNPASSNSRAQRLTQYALSIDMSKELAMVERNAKGKEARLYFIECERQLKMAVLPGDITDYIRRTDGISRMLSHKVTEMEKALALTLNAVATIAGIVQPSRPVLIRHGKTAGQIWRDNGYPPMKGVGAWFGNRLKLVGCQIDNNGHAEMGFCKARLFDPDRADQWLQEGGGSLLVRQKIVERKGQGKLSLVGPKPREVGNE